MSKFVADFFFSFVAFSQCLKFNIIFDQFGKTFLDPQDILVSHQI